MEWRKCVSIPKKGDTGECTNYRRITVLNIAGKIYKKILTKESGRPWNNNRIMHKYLKKAHKVIHT